MKAYDLSSIDVLLVDDHKFTLSYMCEILRILGVREFVLLKMWIQQLR